MTATVLPPLAFHASPNVSARRSIVPYLIVVHRPVGSFVSATRTFLSSRSQVSAHVLTEPGGATQFVPWDRKAWACVSFNSVSYNIEVADVAWLEPGSPAGMRAFREAARIVAFLCTRTGIPPKWSTVPTHMPGVCRHYDLGIAGGGHTDPTTNLTLWRSFMKQVKFEHDRGGFRERWGRGELARIA